jgi:hypothetical protein
VSGGAEVELFVWEISEKEGYQPSQAAIDSMDDFVRNWNNIG